MAVSIHTGFLGGSSIARAQLREERGLHQGPVRKRGRDEVTHPFWESDEQLLEQRSIPSPLQQPRQRGGVGGSIRGFSFLILPTAHA